MPIADHTVKSFRVCSKVITKDCISVCDSRYRIATCNAEITLNTGFTKYVDNIRYYFFLLLSVSRYPSLPMTLRQTAEITYYDEHWGVAYVFL